MAEAVELSGNSHCSICLEKLKSPRILPCLHFFCELCISEYIVSTVKDPEQKMYTCPVCRKIIQPEDTTIDKSKWVTFLPNATPEARNDEKINKQICHPCERFEKNIEASVWCTDCCEALCQNCSDAHRRFKVLSTHKTFPIETETNSSFTDLMEFTDFCPVHKTKPLEVYCADHAKPCCVLCLTMEHRKCENVKSFENMDDVKPANIDKLEAEITNLGGQLTKILDKKLENKKRLASAFEQILTEADRKVRDFKQKIDDLKQTFVKKANITEDDLQQELDANVNQVRAQQSVITKWLHTLKTLKTFGSKHHQFIIIQKIKSHFRKDSLLYMSSLNTDDLDITTEFETITKFTNKLDALGNILIVRNSNHNDLIREMQLSDLLGTCFETVSLKLKSVLSLSGNNILSGVSLDDNTCALLFSNKIELFSLLDEKTFYSMPITGHPKKICYQPSSSKLYVTCNSNLGLSCCVADGRIKDLKSFKFDRMVCGVDIYTNKLYILEDNALLESYNMADRKTIISAIVSGASDDIATDEMTERLAICNFRSSVSFATFEGRTFKEFYSSYKELKPLCITFGPLGILFIGTESKSIFIISQDETKGRIILEKTEKVSEISDIWTDRDNKRLFVCGGGYLEIYDIL